MVYSKIVSSLVKVFRDENPISPKECNFLTALKGDTVSFQTVYISDETFTAKLELSSDFGRHATARSVEYVPSVFPADADSVFKDGNYLRSGKCEYPDVLRNLRGGKIRLTKGKYRTVRIDVEVPVRQKPGDYEITVTLKNSDGEVLCSDVQVITVCNAMLPEAKLIHTEWFHTDCIADYYGYEVFSEPHWKAVENFMKTASKRGINMILTPLFTPPLDTAVGGERTTVQLVDVKCDKGVWSFGFERFDRWIKLAESCGMKYFEMSHLFTQWGSKAAPKVMATVDGEYKRVFGWDTLVADGEYPEFLRKFLPALTAHLKETGIAERCWFHVSDEPSMENYESYCAAREIVSPYLEDFHQLDALSHYEFYENGAIKTPVPSTGRVMEFIRHKVPELWTYYCCGPTVKYSNRFMAMTLARVRSIGVQLFKYNIVGFLHWGFNFYNSQYSIEHIDPYKVTDAGGKFPSGDAFVVYPGAGGKPEESIRLMAFFEAQQDLRALQALEAKTSHEYVMSIVEAGLDSPVEFDSYPESDYYYINLRNRINRELARH